MAGSTNFLQFDSTKTNIASDATYSGVAPGGFVTGTASSQIMNKALFQSSTFAAAFCQILANLGYTVSDSSITTLEAIISAVITYTTTSPLSVSNNIISINANGITNALLAAGTALANLSAGSITNTYLASGTAVANIGYTPVNRAGDTITGNLAVNGTVSTGGVLVAYITNQSLGSNGYRKWSDGRIEQWGSVNISPSGTNTETSVVNFTQTFSTIVETVNITPVMANFGSASTELSTGVSSLSLSSFTAFFDHNGNAFTNTLSFFWYAQGV